MEKLFFTDIVKKLSYLPFKPVLFLRILSNYFKLFILRKKVPRVMDIWATEKCQLKCVHCVNAIPMSQTDRKILALEDYDRIFTAARKLGILNIHLMGGEPLLSKNLYDLIKLAKPNQVIVSMVTNGMLLKDKALNLKKAGLHMVNVSIDSPYDHVHDEIRQHKGCFKNAIEGIREAKRVGLLCFVTMVVNHQNMNNGEVEDMIALMRNWKIELQLLPALARGKWADKKDIVLNKEDQKKFHTLTSQWDVRWDGRTNYTKPGCTAGTERMSIDNFGDVLSCTLLQVPFGNVFDNSLEDIYKKMSSDEIFKKRSSVCRYAFDPEFMKKLESRSLSKV